MLSRNQRSKGFKVKHFLQISVLIALLFWLFKHSYDTTNPYLPHGKTSENPQILDEIASRLGRKHLHPRLHDEEASSDRLELGEVEITKAEDTKDDGHEREERSVDQDEEESEEVEDLIDVDDRDRDKYAGGENEELDKLGESKSQDAIGEHKLMEIDTEKQQHVILI